MAKNMIQVDNGVVINIIWCSNNTPTTDTLIDPADRPVNIGDTYVDGKFYRDGTEILTPLESAQAKIVQLQAENSSLIDDMAQMVEDVYQSDMEMMGL